MRKSSVTRRILNAMLGTKQQKTSQEKVIKQKRRLLMESLEDRRVFAGITEGNIVVYRVGDGAAGLVNTGAAVFLDEYTPTGTLVQTIAMPTTVNGANRQLIASGTASSEGMLNFSTNNQQLVLTGYGRDLGGAGSISGTTSATVNRIVGIVDAATGSIDTTTALTDAASANNIRSVAADGAGNLWVTGGAGGVRHAVVGGTTSTQLSTTVTNLRNAEIFDGQLFVSSSSGTTRLATVGTGLPTTSGQAITNLPGFPTTGSQYGYYFADLDAGVAGVDTLYVASDDAGALTKFSLVGGSWTSNGVIGVAGDAYRGLDGHVNGNRVTLFATRRGGTAAAGGGELVSIVDTSGYNGAFAGTPVILAAAAANTAYRGVAFRGAADYPPVISPITDKLSPTGVPKSIDFTLFDLDTDLTTFNNTTSFVLTSSNQALVKDSNITVIGSGGDRTLRVVPEAGASGDVTISMVVTDSAGNSATETFVLSLLDSRLTVSIDLDPATDGIQSTGEFKKGDVVTADVVMTHPLRVQLPMQT